MQKPVKQVVWWGRGSGAGQYTPSNPGYYIGLPWARRHPFPLTNYLYSQPSALTTALLPPQTPITKIERYRSCAVTVRSGNVLSTRWLGRERGKQEEKAAVVVVDEERKEKKRSTFGKRKNGNLENTKNMIFWIICQRKPLPPLQLYLLWLLVNLIIVVQLFHLSSSIWSNTFVGIFIF